MGSRAEGLGSSLEMPQIKHADPSLAGLLGGIKNPGRKESKTDKTKPDLTILYTGTKLSNLLHECADGKDPRCRKSGTDTCKPGRENERKSNVKPSCRGSSVGTGEPSYACDRRNTSKPG